MLQFLFNVLAKLATCFAGGFLFYLIVTGEIELDKGKHLVVASVWAIVVIVNFVGLTHSSQYKNLLALFIRAKELELKKKIETLEKEDKSAS